MENFTRRQVIQTTGLAALGVAGIAKATEGHEPTIQKTQPITDFQDYKDYSAVKQAQSWEDFHPFEGTEKDAISLMERAGIQASWDFNTALGDTIKEKYESLYLKCFEITNIMTRAGASGYFYIITSPEVSSIFETSSYSFAPIDSGRWTRMYGENNRWRDGQVPIGNDMGVQDCGVVSSKWRLYKAGNIPVGSLLIGVGTVDGPRSHFAHMQIANYVI